MKVNLKDNIWIEVFDNEGDLGYKHFCLAADKSYNLKNIIYSGKTSEIPEEIAKKCVRNEFGETKINKEPIYTYYNYSNYSSRLYTFEIKGDISPKLMEDLWERGGRKKLQNSFILQQNNLFYQLV